MSPSARNLPNLRRSGQWGVMSHAALEMARS